MVVALEGLPGSGKTTLAGALGARLGAEVLRETTADHPFLHQVYDDPARDDLTVELAFLLVHSNPYRRLQRGRLTVCDYSPAKDILFAEDMLDGSDLRLFQSLYEHVYRGYELPDLVVYLRATPELCLERVKERMRSDSRRAFEVGMTVDRLERMAQRYECGLAGLGRRHLVYDVVPGRSEGQTTEDVSELLSPHIRVPTA